MLAEPSFFFKSHESFMLVGRLQESSECSPMFAAAPTGCRLMCSVVVADSVSFPLAAAKFGKNTAPSGSGYR